MSALAPIVLADGQATPVNHTFAPVTIDSAGVAKLVDRASGISIGFPALTMSVRPPAKGGRNHRVMAKIVVPTLEATSPSTASGIQPAPTKAYECIATVEFVLPDRCTVQERTNVLAYMKNLFANANLVNAVTNLETMY